MCISNIIYVPFNLFLTINIPLTLTLQTTFKLGLSYLPLANAGLSALELWSSQLPVKLLHPQLKHILPSLDEYLKTLGTSNGQPTYSNILIMSKLHFLTICCICTSTLHTVNRHRRLINSHLKRLCLFKVVRI